MGAFDEYEFDSATADRVVSFAELDKEARQGYTAFSDRHQEELRHLESSVEARNDALGAAKRALRAEAAGLGETGPKTLALPPFTVQRKTSMVYADGILELLEKEGIYEDAVKLKVVVPQAPKIDARKLVELIAKTKNQALILKSSELLHIEAMTPSVIGPKELVLFGERDEKK